MILKYFKRDSSIAFIASAFSKTIVTVYLFYQSYYLDKVDFGNLAYYRSISMSAIFIGSFGLGSTIIYYYSKKKIEYYGLLITLMRIFPLVSFLVVFTYVKIAYELDLWNFWSFVIGFLALFTSLNLNLQSLYYAKLQHKEYSMYSILGSLSLILIGLPLTLYFGLKGAFLGFLCSQIITTIGLGRKILWSKMIFKIDKQLIEILKFASPIALSALFVYPTFFLLKSIIKNNSGIEFVGSFEIADQVRIILMFVPTTIGLIVFPKMYDLSQKETLKLLRKVILLSFGFVALSTIGLFLFKDLITEVILYKYKDSFYPILFMNFSILFSSLSVFLGNIFIKRKLVWLSFLSNFIWAVITVSSGFILLKFYKPVAATSLGILFGYFSLLMFQVIYIKNSKIKI